VEAVSGEEGRKRGGGGCARRRVADRWRIEDEERREVTVKSPGMREEEAFTAFCSYCWSRYSSSGICKMQSQHDLQILLEIEGVRLVE
jgi:hypothetical protein